MALSRNRIKYIQSLKSKKQRDIHGTFVAEGMKLVTDLLSTCRCQFLVGLPDVIDSFGKCPRVESIIKVDEADLKKTSLLKTPPHIVGVFYQPEHTYDLSGLKSELSLALDAIQDPGNMGTIIRLADWFGITRVFCSRDTNDIYNPKTVQATMGAIARVEVHYVDLEDFLGSQLNIPIYGTFLDGKSIYDEPLSSNGIIVMGNEGKGIRHELETLITRRLFIPSYPPENRTSESLNVAMATAIVCSEFRRRK